VTIYLAIKILDMIINQMVTSPRLDASLEF
jgi:hypothetical protein